MNAKTKLIAGVLLLLALPFVLIACGGDDGDEEPTLDQGLVTKNLSDASYEVQDALPSKGQLPGLVDVDFATGPDSGFEGAIAVSGNGLDPDDGSDDSNAGFVIFYSDAEKAKKADESIGSGEGQQREGNALFVYGTGLKTPPTAFTEMITAAEGQ